MDVVKFIFLAFILIECFHNINVMGYKRQNSTTETQQPVPSTTRQSSPKHPTHGTVTTDLEPTSHSLAGQVTTRFFTTDGVITTIPSCPLNMVFANCTTCQSTCSDPQNCIISNCTEPETCVCSNGFLLKGGDCVPKEECQCFVEGDGVIPEGEFKISSNCSQKCVCTDGQLACDDAYQCSLNAVCEEKNAVLQCYCNEGYTGDGTTCSPNTDCQDVYNRVSNDSGVYKIKPTTWQGEPFEVYCNMTNGGGWTVFQRRVNGAQDFRLNWSEYKVGFGTPDHEVWLGNDKLHSLTTQKNYELRVDIVNIHRDPYFAEYSSFRISNESNNYQLTLGSFRGGNAGDSLSYHHGSSFTTRDDDSWIVVLLLCGQENDNWCRFCKYSGGWWYKQNYNCAPANLNNRYSDCLGWMNLPEGNCGIKYTEMKLRPI